MAKGYGQDVIRRAIDEVPEEAWDDALAEYLEKQCRGRKTSDPAVRRKLIAAAERMGHAPSAALAYIKKRKEGSV